MKDRDTAEAFATSWNHLRQGSIYTSEQFREWMEPLDPASFAGKEVLEMGFGNGSLLLHAGGCRPRRLVGIELGDTMKATSKNLKGLPEGLVELHRGDLTRAELGQFDIVYCIGVIHHLKEPEAGFQAVLRHTRPGGRFHCWVYGWEGNGMVRLLVEPVRRVACRLPWWLNKYAVALPLAVPFYLYSKLVAGLAAWGEWARIFPLQEYCEWISAREFRFFHHVAFDQLVSPQTAYIRKSEIERWLSDPAVDPESTYIMARNGNSWRFGGRLRADGPRRTTGPQSAES